MAKNKPLSRRTGVVVQELDGEVLIYDLEADKAFSLNSTAAVVWRACDGMRDIHDVSAIVEAQLKTAGAEDLVWLALSQLKQDRLIENADEIADVHDGLSRRQVIKKIGLASAVALPIIASLVAPTASHANSACVIMPLSCTCGSNSSGAAAGTICTGTPLFGGLLAMACADSNCRCRVGTFGAANSDDCVP